MMYHPTAKGYFSGCGGMELGLQQAAVRMVQSLDLDGEATGCMEHNRHYFGHNILTCDIKDKEVLVQPRTDIIVGTYPCTKYSTIADIHGTRTGDDLFLHFFRHIAIERPEAYLVENVPGMKKFHVVMEAIARLKDLLDKAPQVHVPDSVIFRLNGKYRDAPIIVDPDEQGVLAPTCVAHYAKDMGTRLVKDLSFPHGVRPFTRREYARLQGFPDDFWLPDSQAAYRLIGNAVPVHMGEWAGQQLMNYFN